ncbi:XAC2610-related protein [Pseudomonas indica]|uniref:XAC2610-related protein n=1 Tax=Pseudomonas indica TaxID=137658 RepID=UPI000BABD4BB|nr:hypothetical protein [Pseudomonas indica]MBU3057792.1 hypothetical protein [Pseudomonas indica]PAU58787.1 hypothetical protein BZL42_12155 [Pseudomonas indica]
MNKKYQGSIILLFAATQTIACDKTIFFPEDSAQAQVLIKNTEVTYSIESKSNKKSETILVDTEKKLSLKLDDYNFDGRKDIAISHIDDGMGNFIVYRIFLYSTQEQDFKEINPNCGEQFLNLRIDSKRKILISTYYENNIPVLCETHPPKL